MADLGADYIQIYQTDGTPLPTELQQIEVTVDAVTKGDYDSFMAKEIDEQPEVLQNLLDSRINRGQLVTPDLGIDLQSVKHVVLLYRHFVAFPIG